MMRLAQHAHAQIQTRFQARPHAQGVALVVVAMLMFTLSDVFAKQLAASLHGIQIAWFRCAGALLLLAPLLVGGRPAFRTAKPGLQILRGLCLLTSTALLAASLRHLGLAEATMLAFLSPFFLTVLSAVLFGDAVSGSHWAAVAIGFAGVVVVVRPGLAELTPAVLLPILSSVCWAVAMICTRRIGEGASSTTTLVWSVAVGFVASSLAVPFRFVAPTGAELLAAAGMAVAWTAAHFCIVHAYRTCPAWRLAPFSYSQVLWSLLAGGVVFSEFPDAPALAGAALIVSGGLLAALRRPKAGDSLPVRR